MATTRSIAALQSRPSPAADLFRAFLIILALVVAAGFVLLILPESAVDKMSQTLQARSSAAPLQEKIALLYLGDEIKEDQFHLRGAVRNITTQPIENLDAVIRLYAPGGDLLETVIIRTDKATIVPDEIAQFHLIYPDYTGQFGSYSVECKLRQGDPVPYKDMRGSRAHN